MGLARTLVPRKPVVLLHAFPLNRHMWDEQMGALEQAGFTPVAFDFPGFGESPLRDAATLERFAAQVLEALDELQVRTAAWIGLSMGGYVLFRVLALAPERVAAMVLADTRAEPDTAEARARRYDQASRVAVEGMPAIAESFVTSALSPTTRSRRPDAVARVREWVLSAPIPGVVNALRAMAQRPDSTPLLATIRVPTLVLVGEHDALTPPESATAMASRIAGARVVQIPDAGHLPNVEAPGRFNDAVVGFLKAAWG